MENTYIYDERRWGKSRVRKEICHFKNCDTLDNVLDSVVVSALKPSSSLVMRCLLAMLFSGMSVSLRQACLTSICICFPGLTVGEMHANCLLFLFAGYETVSSIMSLVLFALAANQDCLQKVREEVDQKIGKASPLLSPLTSS